MSLNYEIIRYKQGLYTRILIHGVNQFKMHVHKELELLLILKGEVQLIVNGIRYNLKEDDMFLVNSGQIHSTIGYGDNIVIAIQINPDVCDRTYPQFRDTVFKWPFDVDTVRYEKIFGELRSHIAQMLEEYRKNEKGYQVAVEGYLNSFITTIIRNIPQSLKKEEGQKNKDLNRITSIIEYVETHYTDKITLEEIAKVSFMSTYYLSHFFKDKMGISFQEYLNYVRLNKAIMLLDKRENNVSEIALDCGFANIKSFNKVFRDVYGTTPGEYRRATELRIIQDPDNVAYMEFDSFQALSKLETYHKYEKDHSKVMAMDIRKTEVKIDANKKGTLFIPWKRMAAVGRAYDCLRADLKDQIRLAKEELGIEYLRFHGIFNDEMRIVTRDTKGKLIFYWQYVDIVLDFLISLGIHPFIDFTFMPTVLSSGDVTVFWYKGNITKPKEIKEWELLITEFTKHCINRYGISKVRKWYFEIWNEPDYVWSSTVQDYYEFYKTTVQTLHSIDLQLQIAGPSVMDPTKEKLSWVKEFIEFINKNNLPLDAFTYHIYGENDFTIKNGSLVSRLGDSQYFTNGIDNFHHLINQLEIPANEIFVTEYNIAAIHKNYLLDTMFPACHMLYNFLKNHNKINGIIPWTLSDIFEEDMELSGPFYGGFGMITQEGIRKPTWYAQWFLSLLGDEVLLQEEEYIVTRKGEDVQILAYSYVFYDDIYRAGDRSLLKYNHRYDVFGHKNELHFSFQFDKLNGCYEKREYRLDRELGSAYDLYERMGCPMELSVEDVAYLHGMARPQIKVNTITVDNELRIDMKIPPHGICMIQLKKQY